MFGENMTAVIDDGYGRWRAHRDAVERHQDLLSRHIHSMEYGSETRQRNTTAIADAELVVVPCDHRRFMTDWASLSRALKAAQKRLTQFQEPRVATSAAAPPPPPMTSVDDALRQQPRQTRRVGRRAPAPGRRPSAGLTACRTRPARTTRPRRRIDRFARSRRRTRRMTEGLKTRGRRAETSPDPTGERALCKPAAFQAPRKRAQTKTGAPEDAPVLRFRRGGAGNS